MEGQRVFMLAIACKVFKTKTFREFVNNCGLMILKALVSYALEIVMASHVRLDL